MYKNVYQMKAHHAEPVQGVIHSKGDKNQETRRERRPDRPEIREIPDRMIIRKEHIIIADKISFEDRAVNRQTNDRQVKKNKDRTV